MGYDSVIGQQSISGKNVSLILCVCMEALLCEIRSHIVTATSLILHNVITTNNEVSNLVSYPLSNA